MSFVREHIVKPLTRSRGWRFLPVETEDIREKGGLMNYLIIMILLCAVVLMAALACIVDWSAEAWW